MGERMKIFVKKFISLFIAFVVVVATVTYAIPKEVKASDHLDEILNYEITVDVNEDATLNMTYHVEWKVLDSDSEGPLSWARIGIPNNHILDYVALSDNIESMDIVYNGGYYMDVYFYEDYYEDEVVSFDFMIVQDYMYQITIDDEATFGGENEEIPVTEYTTEEVTEIAPETEMENGTEVVTETEQTEGALVDGGDDIQWKGYATYYFTPGWFDEIDVDMLTLRWNSENVTSWYPTAIIEDGYLVWRQPLPAGEHLDVEIEYDLSAYAFDMTKTDEIDSSGDWDYDYDYYYDDDDDFEGGIFSVFVVLFIAFAIVKAIVSDSYKSNAGFTTTYKTKVTRTKIVYHESCPNCGGAKAEGKDICQYCGTSMIKSKEIIDETKVPEEDKEAMQYSTKGTYRYSSDPFTYVHVDVDRVAVKTPVHRSGGSHHSGGGGCACACASSCACACACACAGGGRAGCSSKDFYKGGLDPKRIMLRNKKKHK